MNGGIDELISDASRRMDKSVESTQVEFNTVRTGRASAALLDRISVDYYGQKTPLKQLATINVPEPRMLTITPFDKSIMKDIERGILESDLGLTPSNDGQLIERRLRAVVIDLDPVEQCRRGAARSQCVELVLGGLDGFVHPAGRVVNELVDGHLSAPEFGVETMVPTRSPSTTRRMLPSASAKTWIGR